MNLLYNAGISLYSTVARIASVKSRKIATMLAGQRETLSNLAIKRKHIAPEGYDLWVHAASLGEFEQGRPLIERFKHEHPKSKVLLSFFSPSGYEVRKNYKGADTVVYLPFDKPSDVKKFIDAAKPRCAVFVKYEFWGNYITTLHARNIPVYIISAIFRPGQIFFRPWGEDFRKILYSYNHIFVQDQKSAQLLAGIGINNVTVAGDTRFDRVSDVMAAHRELPEIEQFCTDSQFTLVVGSSWPQDEDAYIGWLHSHPEVKAICAPHEFDNERLESLVKRFGDGATLYSEYVAGKASPASLKYLIIDCFGLLSSLYRYGDAAIIGGGFGAGIHNINEAAVYGIPVIFGPHNQKFKEATDIVACGGGFVMTDSAECAKILDTLLSNEVARRKAGDAAGAYIRDNIGATECIYKAIFT